jgi:hypothetical protein
LGLAIRANSIFSSTILQRSIFKNLCESIAFLIYFVFIIRNIQLRVSDPLDRLQFNSIKRRSIEPLARHLVPGIGNQFVVRNPTARCRSHLIALS